MKILENPCECVGCGLCANVCPKKCITLEVTREGGFCYPKIDENACVSCGKCQQLCPVLKDSRRIEPLDCFALNDKREVNRLKSASGGASALFMEEVLQNGGVVCSCRLDENLKPEHNVFADIESVDLYRDSKYVQSDFSSAWGKIDESIKAGKKILITGTPCQIAAVHSRYGDCENIITVDFVCSGVPDPGIFELYLKNLENIRGSKIRKFYFRDKTNGWKKSNIRVVYEDGTEQIIVRKGCDYFELFGSNIFFRECCFDCKFKNFNTYSDITVGDYWGIEKEYPHMDDDKGCSLVIVNTEKGEELLKAVADRCVLESTPLEYALKTHPKLEHSISVGACRKMFYKTYKNGDANSFAKAIELSLGRSFFNKVLRKIRILLKY